MLSETVKGWTEQWKAEGLQQGRQEGRQEGLREGQAKILMVLLEKKFGPLQETDRQRIHAADSETLLKWGERLITANSLSEVMV